MKALKAPTLTFSYYAFTKMNYLAKKATTEIGFWCLGSDKDPLYIEDITVLKQEANVVFNKFDDEAVAEYCGQMHGEGYSLDQFAMVWGHTHPKGCSASPSQTDEKTFSGDTFGGKSRLVMFIISQSGDMYARLRVTDEATGPIELEMDIEVDHDSFAEFIGLVKEEDDIIAEWDESLKLVSPMKTPVHTANWKRPWSSSSSYSVSPTVSTEVSTADDGLFGKSGDDLDDDFDDCGLWTPSSSLYTSGYSYAKEPEEYHNMEPLHDLLVMHDEDEEGHTSDIREITEEECMTKFGCDNAELEEVYLDLCCDLSETVAAGLLEVCAESNVPLRQYAGLASLNPAQLLRDLGFTPKKNKLIEDEVVRFFKKTKRTYILDKVNSEDLPF